MQATCVETAPYRVNRELLRTMFADLHRDMLEALRAAGAGRQDLAAAETYLFKLPDLYLNRMAELPDGRWPEISEMAIQAMVTVGYLTGDLRAWTLPELPYRAGAILRQRAEELRSRLNEIYLTARERCGELQPPTIH